MLVTLVNGEVILIEGFFTPDGIPENQLFISSNGQLDEVELTAGQDGAYWPNYTAYENFGKWSPEDDLYFVRGSEVQLASYDAYVPADDQAGMLFTPLLGGLGGIGLGGAAAAAAVIGGAVIIGGGGGGGSTLVVDVTHGAGNGDVVNADDYADGVEIGGTGTVGATVTVTVEGVTQTTTVDTDGNWEVVFPPGSVPDGTYTTDAVVEISNGTSTVTTTETVIFDTEASVSLVTATVETDGIVNAAEASDGVVLTGTVEAGSTVVVTVAGVDYDATVTGGSWSVTIPSVAPGEYDLDVSVTATDAYRNTVTTSGTVVVDTMTDIVMATGLVAGDGTVNAAEHAAGTTVTGYAEAGASVVVTIGSASHTITAGADGAWSATFSAS